MVPCNDGGISLGQVVIANSILVNTAKYSNVHNEEVATDKVE